MEIQYDVSEEFKVIREMLSTTMERLGNLEEENVRLITLVKEFMANVDVELDAVSEGIDGIWLVRDASLKDEIESEKQDEPKGITFMREGSSSFEGMAQACKNLSRQNGLYRSGG